MRILVTITDSHPELLASLKSIPKRSRSERIKMLATVGLFLKNGGTITTEDKPPKKTSSESVIGATKNMLASFDNLDL